MGEDVFSSTHPAKKNITHFLKTIEFIKQQKIEIQEEILEISFIILPSYPDMSAFLLPFYNIIWESKEDLESCCDNKDSCRIVNAKQRVFGEVGECVCCLLKSKGAPVAKNNSKKALENAKDIIFNQQKIKVAIPRHVERIKEVYKNTGNLEDFDVRLFSHENLDIFRYHSCIALIFSGYTNTVGDKEK